MTNQSLWQQGHDNSALGGPGVVPPPKAARKRFPFVFIIDVSHSTGDQPDPDINHINQAISTLLDMLRNPAPSSELLKQVDAIDLCIIAYSNTPEVILPWHIVEKLPPALPTLTPLYNTHTGAAIDAALQQIRDRLAYYKDPQQNLAFGMPHIIHLTDGAMNDIVPGTPAWEDIKARLNNLSSGSESRKVTLIHFVTPKGCDRARIDVGGRMMSGQEMLGELTGKETVFEMTNELSSFERLIVLITVVISRISQYGNLTAVQAMRNAIDDAEAN